MHHAQFFSTHKLIFTAMVKNKYFVRGKDVDPPLFMAQGLNRIKASGLAGRKKAEDDADRAGK